MYLVLLHHIYISHYYINKTVTTSIDCNKLLIIYKPSINKKRKENGIYLNANLHHATNNKNGMKDIPLIIYPGASCVLG